MHPIAAAVHETGLDLLPFQRRFIAGAFAAGTNIAALSTPRGAGKTELIGRLGGLAVVPGSPLCRPGLEAVLFAGSMRQARPLFRAAQRAIPPGVKVRKRDNSQELSIRGADGTALHVYPSSGKRAMGLGAGEHLFLCDEPASWEDRDGALLWDAVTGALGKVPDARVVAIGTLSPAPMAHWWPRLVEAGTMGSTYVQVHQKRKADRWDSMRTAERCNPLLAVNATLRDVVAGELAKAKRDPELQPAYEAYRLNAHRSVDADQLVDPDEWRRVLERPVEDRNGAAVLGIDLGASRSWSAAALAWPSGRLEVYASIPGIPDLAAQERRDGLTRGTLARLVAAGVVAVAEGKRVADAGLVLDLLPDVEVAGCVADRFAAEVLTDELSSRGLPAAEWRVGQWSQASADIAAFRAAALDGPLSVPGAGRELCTLSLAATKIERDTSGSMRLRKTHRRRRDDVSQAAVLALGALARWPKPVPLRVLTLA